MSYMTEVDPKPIPRTGRYAEIVQEATLMFGEVGYERATVRMLSERLGIKCGSLYSHISSKEDVLSWVILDVAELFTMHGRHAVQGAESAEAQLRALCRSHMQVVSEEQLRVSVYFEEWRKLDDNHRANIVSLRDEYEELLGSVIRKGLETEAFDCDPVMTARLILSALNSTVGWYRQDGEYSAEQIADSIVDIFLKGMRPR